MFVNNKLYDFDATTTLKYFSCRKDITTKRSCWNFYMDKIWKKKSPSTNPKIIRIITFRVLKPSVFVEGHVKIDLPGSTFLRMTKIYSLDIPPTTREIRFPRWSEATFGGWSEWFERWRCEGWVGLGLGHIQGTDVTGVKGVEICPP